MLLFSIFYLGIIVFEYLSFILPQAAEGSFTFEAHSEALELGLVSVNSIKNGVWALIPTVINKAKKSSFVFITFRVFILFAYIKYSSCIQTDY